MAPSSVIYRQFMDMFYFTNFVPDLIILTISIVCVDIGLNHAHRSIKFLRALKEEKLERRRMQRLERDSAKILKIKTFSCKAALFTL